MSLDQVSPTPTEEIEEEFRFMITQVASGLLVADCERIVYLKHLPKDTCIPNHEKQDVQLYTLISLEARGFMTPLNPDPLRKLLVKIDRQNLTKHVDDYITKRMALMKKMEKIEKERKKSIKKQKNKKGESIEQHHQAETAFNELFRFKAASSTKEQLKRLQTLTLSYISHLMQNAQRLHAVIHDDDSTEGFQQQKKEACEAVLEETEKFDRKFRKVLSTAKLSSSSSSDDSLSDKRKNSDSPLPHRKIDRLHFPKMEQGTGQLNLVTAHKPVPVSGGIAVMPSPAAKVVTLPKPARVWKKVTTDQLRGTRSANSSPIVPRKKTVSMQRSPPLPPPKPKFTREQRTNAERLSSPEKQTNSNQGSGDSGIYITHSLPFGLDDDHQDQLPVKGPHYENISYTDDDDEHKYEPIEYGDNDTNGGSVKLNDVYEDVNYDGPVKNMHMKARRARSMDDTLNFQSRWDRDWK